MQASESAVTTIDEREAASIAKGMNCKAPPPIDGIAMQLPTSVALTPAATLRMGARYGRKKIRAAAKIN